jgi:hypothetical protein
MLLSACSVSRFEEMLTTRQKMNALRTLQSHVDSLRKEMGISNPGQVTFMASCDNIDDEVVVVEADGFGGATLSLVEGNYPIDYITKFERSFRTERLAEIAAEKIAFRDVSPERIFMPLAN